MPVKKKVRAGKSKTSGSDNKIIDDNAEKPAISISDLPEKQQAFLLLKENGLTNREAGKVLGYTEGTARVVSSKINKYSLMNKKMVQSAHGAVKNILEGKTWGSIDKIKDSTAMQAAQMVYDRTEPVKKMEVGDTNISFTQINLSISNNKDADVIDI